RMEARHERAGARTARGTYLGPRYPRGAFHLEYAGRAVAAGSIEGRRESLLKTNKCVRLDAGAVVTEAAHSELRVWPEALCPKGTHAIRRARADGRDCRRLCF